MGIVRLLSVSKQAKLEIIAASVRDRRFRPLARGSETFTFSPEERIEVTILGLKTIVGQDVLSHHFENLKHLLQQHLRQHQ